MLRIRVNTRKYANLGDGLRAFEPGVVYELPQALADHPWIKQHAEIVPGSDDDRVFDAMFNRWRTRREIAEELEQAEIREAKAVEERKQRAIAEAEEKERREIEAAKAKKRWAIADKLETAQINAKELARILRGPAGDVMHEKKRGRTVGTGYGAKDDLLVAKARQFLSSGEAKSITEAVTKVAGEAPGIGSEASKIKRLVARARITQKNSHRAQERK